MELLSLKARLLPESPSLPDSADSDDGDVRPTDLLEFGRSVEPGETGETVFVVGWRIGIQGGEPCGELFWDASWSR